LRGDIADIKPASILLRVDELDQGGDDDHRVKPRIKRESPEVLARRHGQASTVPDSRRSLWQERGRRFGDLRGTRMGSGTLYVRVLCGEPRFHPRPI